MNSVEGTSPRDHHMALQSSLVSESFLWDQPAAGKRFSQHTPVIYKGHLGKASDMTVADTKL